MTGSCVKAGRDSSGVGGVSNWNGNVTRWRGVGPLGRGKTHVCLDEQHEVSIFLGSMRYASKMEVQVAHKSALDCGLSHVRRGVAKSSKAYNVLQAVD